MEEKDIIVVGSGPAGLSAALYSKIDGWDTLILESAWAGGQGAIAYTVSNFPGFPPGDGAVLMKSMSDQVTAPPPAGVGAELKYENVTRINSKDMTVTTEKSSYRARVIILATGSTMQKLGIAGEDKFTGRGVSFYARRDLDEFTNKRVLVIGGGNTTAKTALLAKTVAESVTLIHRREALRTYPAMTKRLHLEGITIIYNTEARAITGDSRVEAVSVIDNTTGQERELAIDWVIVCVGTEPDNSLATGAGLAMEGKFVKVNKKYMTSAEGIFACGEITGCERHLITAASEGSLAGMAASEYLALQQVRGGRMFEGAKNGKYADEYLALLHGQ